MDQEQFETAFEKVNSAYEKAYAKGLDIKWYEILNLASLACESFDGDYTDLEAQLAYYENCLEAQCSDHKK